MDWVLEMCDEYFLDRAWASVVPASAFADTLLSNSSAAYMPISSQSTWSQLVSHLPHPPLSLDKGLASFADESMAYATEPLLSAWPRSYMPRQLISLSILTILGIHLLYFITATASYYFIFNHDMMRHPRFLKNQVKLEIWTSFKAFPMMTLFTLPWFQGEVMGYSKLYDGPATYGYTWLILSVPTFLLFTDYCIYWVHRILHIPAIYKHVHKPHHKWIIPTPFASHAFHPLDGYLQSVPYHAFIYIFPLNRMVFLSLFVFVNFWSIFIHDSDMITGHPLEKVINGPAHHTLHHMYFTVNYGQYFTWADRVGGSYRHPDSSLDPMLDVKARDEKLKAQ